MGGAVVGELPPVAVTDEVALPMVIVGPAVLPVVVGVTGVGGGHRVGARR